MTAAKKQPIPEPEDSLENDELQFDVNDDWRKDPAAKDQTNIFKEDDMELKDDELDISALSLDTKGEIAKESAIEHAKKMAKQRRGKNKKSGVETLANLQAAAVGEGGELEEDMEIISEEDQKLVNDPIFTNKGDQYPQIHGNYFLLDHLVDGGMAKVCRARYLGEGDEADKMVAIKMVQEKFSSDDDFVQMFIDEIKVSFGLNHPNINTTFDYGKIGKNLFVSMEYIHGKDLMVVVDKLKAEGKTIPIPMSIFIASKMCEALHYAHNFTNKLTGQKYNIVHRDISPHNAMISYEGFVKVIDFGIAKADTNSQKEEEGTVKGKINYFAPEYLEGKKIDHRYDQFAVALTLWEMLTGRKTFTGQDQIHTLKAIYECNPELPSKYNKKIPKALEKIIMKALSKDPKDRYKDMQFFNKELMKVLYQTFPDFHESDIADMMKEVFQSSYEADLEKFKKFGEYSISDIVKKINAFKEFQKRQVEKAKAGGGKAKEVEFDFGFGEESVSVRGKRGVDSLVNKKKKKEKEKPGLNLEKNYRKQQKKLLSMIEEEDFVKPDSFISQNKGVFFLAAVLGIAFFQRELILNTVLGTGDKLFEPSKYSSLDEEDTTAIKRGQEQKEFTKNEEFLKKLKAKKEGQANGAPQKQQPQQPPVQKRKNTPQPVKAQAKAEPPVQKEKEIVPVSGNKVKEIISTLKTPNQPQKPQEAQATESVAKRAPANEAVADQAPAPEKSETEELVDVQNLSLDDLKKRMKERMAKEREKLLKEEKLLAPETSLSKSPSVSQENIPEEPKLDTPQAGATEETKPEGSAVSPSDLARNGGALQESSEEVAEDVIGDESEETFSEGNTPEESLSSKAASVLDQIKAKQEPKAPPPEGQGAAVAQKAETPEKEDKKLEENKNLSDTEKELLRLKERMKKILEDQKNLESGTPTLDKKPSITLEESNSESETESQPEEAKASDEELTPEEIKRKLASKLDNLEEDEGTEKSAPVVEEKGTVDKVLNFIKTRRAFGWMFSE